MLDRRQIVLNLLRFVIYCAAYEINSLFSLVHYKYLFILFQVPQSSGLRTFLRGKYAAVKLHQSRELYMPKDALDIAVNAGDLVGIIQKKDPMGNTKRWFVDNGITQVR